MSDNSQNKTFKWIFGLPLAVFVMAGLWGAVKRVLSENGRSPAAINRQNIFDLSGLDGGVLKSASARQILHEAIVKQAMNQRNQELEVHLGHFYAKASNGESESLCKAFDIIELSFEAEGMAINGERPKLTISAPCVLVENTNRLQPIRVPYKDLMSQRPGDRELSVGGYSEYIFKTASMPSQWPDYWVLSEMKFVSRINNSNFLKFDKREIYVSSSRPIILEFK